METHGGGGGKAKLDKIDKSGALQGGTVRVRASRSWARPAPRSEFFYLTGRAANSPLDARPQSAVGRDHDTARRSLTAGQRVSGHLQRSLVASVSDRDASYGTTVSKMCHVRARCFFLVGLGRSGAAEQQGAPSPFPWDPWERSDRWVTAAEVVSLKVPSYKVKEV